MATGHGVSYISINCILSLAPFQWFINGIIDAGELMLK